MKFPAHSFGVAALIALACCASGTVLAGRPLAVDDANVNDVNAGHVETYYQRQPGSSNTWTIAPAYGIAEGVEIAASFNRDNTADVNTTGLQVKFRFTDSQKVGCNFGGTLGATQANPGTGNAPFVNMLATCNSDAGSIHFNLGAVRSPGGPTLGTWGVALEREFGDVTAHVEAFGMENSQPTVQLGLRTMVTKSIQLDGTVGRANDESIYSVGLKFLF
jgi:hypothetical protein